MKEEICIKKLRRSKQSRIISELIELLPSKFDAGTYGDYSIRINKTIGYEERKIGFIFKKIKKVPTIKYAVAYIWVDDDEIEVMDEELYPLLKEYGKKHKFKKLIKCWEGVE